MGRPSDGPLREGALSSEWCCSWFCLLSSDSVSNCCWRLAAVGDVSVVRRPALEEAPAEGGRYGNEERVRREE